MPVMKAGTLVTFTTPGGARQVLVTDRGEVPDRLELPDGAQGVLSGSEFKGPDWVPPAGTPLLTAAPPKGGIGVQLGWPGQLWVREG